MKFSDHLTLLKYLSPLGCRTVYAVVTVRPSMPETTALGAAMAAGYSIGVWSLKPQDLTAITTDVFKPVISTEG